MLLAALRDFLAIFRLRSAATGSLSVLLGLMSFVSLSGPAHSAEPVFNWKKESDAAPWKPRDSAGEVVFKDKLWMMGGWFDSHQPYYRDVWSSSNGKDWSLEVEQAPWTAADLPMTVTFKDRIWFMGGWFNGRLPGAGPRNEIWSSADGRNWELTRTNKVWSPRFAAGATVFKGRMWIIGGLVDNFTSKIEDRRNDVWSSENGVDWTLETEQAPWAARAYHGVLTFQDKLWVIGGGNYLPEFDAHNDVWCSEDGRNWTLVTDKAAFPPRIWFSTVVYRDHMWLMGGWTRVPDQNWKDVWYSKDGKEWKALKSDVVWKERHEHSAYVMNDKIWVAGGHARPLSNEVWSLELPKDWTGQE